MNMMAMNQIDVLNDQLNELVYERAERYDEGDLDAVAELDYQISSIEDQMSMLEDPSFNGDFEDDYFDEEDDYGYDEYGYGF